MVRNISRRWIPVAALALVAGAGMSSVNAATDLSLWGVTPGGTNFAVNTYANWTPGATANQNNSAAVTTGTYAGGSGAYTNISYSIWDGYGPRSGPISGNGGQNFDVKAMYAADDGTTLHVGIVTGINPDGFTYTNGHPYAAGDLAIDPNLSSNTADFGLKTVLAPATLAGTSGTGLDLESGGTWSNPAFDGFTNTPPYTVLNGGTILFSDATYTYTDLGISYADLGGAPSAEEYLMEFNIKNSELGSDIDNPLTLGFGPNCGNDYMTVTVTPSTGSGVPEPASLSILGIAGIGLMMNRRKRR